MRILLLGAALATTTLLGTLAGCTRSEPAAAQATAEPAAEVPAITIAELAALLATGGARAVDANGERTRARMGVIPHAVLLTDSAEYLPSELPADKAGTLVFYCMNPSCSASHEAAARARLAGYTELRVLPDGIAGWVKAGQPVQARAAAAAPAAP